MSAENTPDPLAGLDYFEPSAIKDAEGLFGPIDESTIQEVLDDSTVVKLVVLLGIAKQVRESGDPEQTRRYERAFGLLNTAAEKTHGHKRHCIALYLANRAVGRRALQNSDEQTS